MGGPPPWAHLTPAARKLSLSDIAAALADRRPPTTLGAVPSGTQESAVLAILYEEAGEIHVILTRRSPLMRHHAHEMSFPGGRRDPGDATLWSTAVRESVEEVALDPALIEPIGALDRFVTGGSGVLVQPFVAVANRRPELSVASPREVESIRHVGMAELLLDEVWREEVWPDFRGQGDRAITFFEVMGDTIWGATATMLRQLLAIATGTEDP